MAGASAEQMRTLEVSITDQIAMAEARINTQLEDRVVRETTGIDTAVSAKFESEKLDIATEVKNQLEIIKAGVQKVVEETTEIGALRILSQTAVTLGEVERFRGNFDEAQRHLERAERLFRATGQRVSLSRCLAERALTALAMGELMAAQGFAAGSGMAASLTSGVLLGQERIHCAIGKVAEAQGDRAGLASARQATLDCLDRQAVQLGPEHLGRWASVGPRMEAVTWVGWSPKC